MKQTENYKDTVFYKVHHVDHKKRCVMLSSTNEQGIAYIVFKVGDNRYVFMTGDGYLATAIFNPFVCMYYVDDKYSKIDIESALTMREQYEKECADSGIWYPTNF